MALRFTILNQARGEYKTTENKTKRIRFSSSQIKASGLKWKKVSLEHRLCSMFAE